PPRTHPVFREHDGRAARDGKLQYGSLIGIFGRVRSEIDILRVDCDSAPEIPMPARENCRHSRSHHFRRGIDRIRTNRALRTRKRASDQGGEQDHATDGGSFRATQYCSTSMRWPPFSKESFADGVACAKIRLLHTGSCCSTVVTPVSNFMKSARTAVFSLAIA